MTKKVYLTSILIIQCSILFAQVKLRDNMFLDKLPNGLEVLVVEDNSTPLATVMITFKAGPFTETPQTNGLCALYQTMTLQANKNFKTSWDFRASAAHLGAGLMNTRGTPEYTSIFFTLPKSNLDTGLAMMNNCIRFPQINIDELEREKQADNSQLLGKESDAFFLLSDATLRRVWGDQFYRKSAIGTHEVIQSATRQLLLDSVRNKYYYPNNALLIIAGDVKHDEAFKKAGLIYGSWKRSSFDPPKKWPVPEFKPLSRTDYIVVESKEARTPYLTLTWQGPDTRGDIQSTYAADVFSYIMNQNSSRLKQALIQSGLASNVDVNYLTQKYKGPITISVLPNPLKVKECLQELKHQIDLMDNADYVSDEQMATAKRKLAIRQVRQEEITTDYVHTLGFWWASASLDYFMTYNDNLGKVSRGDLQAYVRRFIKNKPYCAGLLTSPELKAQLNTDSFFTANN